MSSSKLTEILDLLQAKRSGSQWMAKCPAHEDSKPSLSISEEGGKILLHCHGGCETKDVLGAMGMTYEDLREGPRIVAEYNYHNERGEVLFQVVRFEPKNFKQRHSDGAGGWVWNLNGTRRVLYNLPEVLKADFVLICEGEKDVETARKLGLVATTNPGGAQKWRPEYNGAFVDKNVVIIPDGDPPGRKHAEHVAATVAEVASTVSICNLPSGIKDPSDFIALGFSKESLIQLIKAAPLWKPGTCTETEFLELFHTPEECENVPDISFAIEGFLQNEGMTFVGGLSGHSKTWLMLSIVKALSTGKGTTLWGLFPVKETATRVLYLIPEVGLASFMSRARRMGLMPFIRERRLLVRTLSKGPAPGLDDPLLLAATKGAHIVLDTAVRFSEGDMNSASDNARGLAADIFGLITAGARTVICAHHSPKAFEKQNAMSLQAILSGTGDIGAMATTVWGIKQLDEAQNIVYLECVKARDFAHCQPFQLQGRPAIDEGGDFILHRAPGESGTLAEEQLNPYNDAQQQQKDDRLTMVRSWMDADPNETAQEQVQKFAAMGITIKLDTVQRYRKQVRKGL